MCMIKKRKNRRPRRPGPSRAKQWMPTLFDEEYIALWKEHLGVKPPPDWFVNAAKRKKRRSDTRSDTGQEAKAEARAGAEARGARRR